ncbi:MAG: site-specific integrase [Syntrophomonadaceae bacterium]|nr:site-specific integrase [Syntrophomonadaceae bacterium]
MLQGAKETTYFPLLFAAVRTGLRRGELLGLRWKDIDLKTGTLSVKQSLAYTLAKGLFFKPPKNKRSRRTIHISKEVIDVFKHQKKLQNEARLFYGEKYQDGDLVFSQHNGKPMHPDTPTSWLPDFLGRVKIHKTCNNLIKNEEICPHCCKKVREMDIIKLPRLNLHSLRHTHASHLLQAGVDIKIISERLGHSSIRITYDIYSHLMPGMQKDAADKLEALFRK